MQVWDVLEDELAKQIVLAYGLVRWLAIVKALLSILFVHLLCQSNLNERSRGATSVLNVALEVAHIAYLGRCLGYSATYVPALAIRRYTRGLPQLWFRTCRDVQGFQWQQTHSAWRKMIGHLGKRLSSTDS